MTRDEQEVTIRETWRGCEWLGIESFRAPRHGAPRIDWSTVRGTYDWSERAHIGQGGSIR